MNPRSNIFLWLFATVAVAALTAWSVTHRVPPATASPPQGLAPSLHEWMHQQLDITPKQHTALDQLESAYEAERVRLRQLIRQLGSDLAIAIRDAAPDAAMISAQEKLNAAQGQLQQATLRHFIGMKQHLTPAQAVKLAAWTHDSILLQPEP
jgi:hypothetical protein